MNWLQTITRSYLQERTLETLAKKHDVSVEDLKKQLEMGVEVEKEHTKDEDKARSIAMDHLEEVPNYYSKLKKYVEPKKVQESMSYTNNWTQIIRQLMIESHTKEELMKLSNDELKKLHSEYSAKDDDDSQEEAKEIKDILDSRGDEKEEVKEETRKEMKNLAHAYGWDKPAPEGTGSAKDRLARVRENMKRLGTRGTRDAIPAGLETAEKIEDANIESPVHEPTARQRAAGQTNNPRGTTQIHRSIEGITDKVAWKDLKRRGLLKNPEQTNESKIMKTVKKIVNKGKKVAGKVGKAMIHDQRAKGIYDQPKY